MHRDQNKTIFCCIGQPPCDNGGASLMIKADLDKSVQVKRQKIWASMSLLNC